MGEQYPSLDHFEGIATDRVVEEPWTIDHVRPGERLLDVGSATSRYLHKLPEGCVIYAIDLRPTRPEPGLGIVRGDLLNAPFQPGSFDVITCISTIEHVGCDVYGQGPDEFGDEVAMRHMRSLLRPGGRLLVTSPFGRRRVTAWFRVYDWRSFRRIAAGYRMLSVDFYRREGEQYLPCRRRDVTGADFDWSHTRSNAVILAELTPAGGFAFFLSRLLLRLRRSLRQLRHRRRIWRFWGDPEVV